MKFEASYLFAAALVLVLLVALAFAWYHWPGSWSEFEYRGDDKVTFRSPKGAGNLRFKMCKFTTADPSGRVHTWDVTAVLNGMAAAYDRGDDRIKELRIGNSSEGQIPLNPFSFKKSGINTRNEVPTPGDRARWADVPPQSVVLNGLVRKI